MYETLPKWEQMIDNKGKKKKKKRPDNKKKLKLIQN